METVNYNPALVRIAADAIRTAITDRLGIHGKSLTDVAGEMTWVGIGRQVLEALADAEVEPTPGPQIDHDPVHAPSHYRQLPNGIEVIDITENLDFLLGNVVKYVLRAEHKGNPVQDLQKARWYLDRAIARRKGEGS